MIFLDFFTGLRRNEIRALQWGAFKDGFLEINKQLGKEYTFENNKSKVNSNKLRSLKTESSLRSLPLPLVAINLLNKIKVESAKKYFRLGLKFNDDSFIFTDDLCKPIEEKLANRRLKSICKKLEIDPRPFHSIRHSYATRLFEQEVDIKTVQELLGHSDYKTTLEIYIHVMPDQKKKAITIFDKIYKTL